MARFLSTRALEDQGLLPRLRGNQFLRWAGLISILVAICNVVDDLSLQYRPQGYEGAGAFLGIAPGTVFHGTFMAMVFAEQAAAGAPASAQSIFLTLETQLNIAIVPLSLFFLVCYLTMWGIFTVTILRKASPFPRWMIFFTPALWSLLIVLLYESHTVPWLGNLLYPTVLSLPHLVFYVLCTIVVWRINEGKRA